MQAADDRRRPDPFYLDDQARADLEGIMRARGMRPKVDKSRVVREALRTVAAALGVPALVPEQPADAWRGPRAVVDRVLAVMRRLGFSSPVAVDAHAEVSHGTTRNVLHGLTPLASAGSGRLLAWVEQQEAGGVAP